MLERKEDRIFFIVIKIQFPLYLKPSDCHTTQGFVGLIYATWQESSFSRFWKRCDKLNVDPLLKIPCCTLLSPSLIWQIPLYSHFCLGLMSSGICVSSFVGWCEWIHVYSSFENFSQGPCSGNLTIIQKKMWFEPTTESNRDFEKVFFLFLSNYWKENKAVCKTPVKLHAIGFCE